MGLIKTVYHHLIGKRRKELPFLVMFAFLFTFAVSRLIVYLALEGYLPESLFLHVRGVHIHHLSYGIIILALFGYVMLMLPGFVTKHIHFLALVYGFGLGLTFDEFGMWIHLDDSYWIRQSYDAVIVITAIFLNIVYFYPFWKGLGKSLLTQFRRFLRHPETALKK